MVALLGRLRFRQVHLLRHLPGFVAADSGSVLGSAARVAIQANGIISRDIRQLRGEIGFVFQQFIR